MKFVDLKIGDWFEYEGSKYMKVSVSKRDIEYLAIDLETGYLNDTTQFKIPPSAWFSDDPRAVVRNLKVNKLEKSW